MKMGDGDYLDVEFECSGRRDSANRRIIGIDPDLNTWGGYDGAFPEEPFNEEQGWGTVPLTPQERNELALYMLGLWGRYLINTVGAKDPNDPVVFETCPVCSCPRQRRL